MYAFIDRPVENLRNSGRFLLWAMREWISAFERGQCPPHALSHGFAGVRALRALPDFHVAMALLNCDALEPLALNSVNCATIAEDEAILLGLWHDHTQGRTVATLALLVDAESIRPIGTALWAAAAALGAAGFDLADISFEAAPSQESQDK